MREVEHVVYSSTMLLLKESFDWTKKIASRPAVTTVKPDPYGIERDAHTEDESTVAVNGLFAALLSKIRDLLMMAVLP